LYHDSDIYLFDDILSAVDSQVASWILEKAIMGPQMKQKTRLLSTHNLHVINLTQTDCSMLLLSSNINVYHI
jgi:ATP-binding cassette subfamily C (CFTR/MRP) protein 10